MSEWICHLRPAHLYCESPVDIPFTNTVKNKFRRETPASQMSSVITLLCSRINLTLGAAVTDMGNQNALGVIGLQGGRNHVVAFSCQRQGGCGFCNGEQRQNCHQNSLVPQDLWHWLINHGIPNNITSDKVNLFTAKPTHESLHQLKSLN